MKLAVIVVTPAGFKTARRIQEIFPDAELFAAPGLYADLHADLGPDLQAGLPADIQERESGVKTYAGDLKTFVGTLFPRMDALIFVTAVGIAVRVISPYIKDKLSDPAVVAVDDTGRFAVSLLSGHLGGANKLASILAEKMGATAVITTSTDRHGLMAYDLLAAQINGTVERLEDLKKISMAQLAGKQILVYADANIQLEFPGMGRLLRSEEDLQEKARYGAVWISSRNDPPRLAPGVPLAVIRPPTLTVGLGCRKGTPAQDILEAVQRALKTSGRSPASLCQLASMDVKAGEPGLLEAGECLGVRVRFFSKDEVRTVEHLFNSSSFVHEAVGTGSVAEPCAYLGSGRGKMLLGKTAWKKITVALAESTLSSQLNGGHEE